MAEDFSPIKKKKRYEQKYRKQWEELDIFKGWLTHVPGHPTKAYCRACKHMLNCGKLDLEKHYKSLKHRKHYSSLPRQNIKAESFENDEYEYMEVPVDIKPEMITKYKAANFEKSNEIECIKSAETIYMTETSDNPITDEFAAFGQYVGLELKASPDPFAIHIAKLEINRVLYSLSTGEYDATLISTT